jgi:hypothetical protein
LPHANRPLKMPIATTAAQKLLLRHQFESGKTQKTAGRRLSVAIGNTKVTIAITITYSGLRNV